jgi:hypothetical protein
MPLKSPVLTEEQRKEQYVHPCFPFIFKSNVDLTDGIIVSLFESIDVTKCKSSELYCAMAGFVATWTLDIWQHLNGWPGFSCLKYSFDFDVSKLRQDAVHPSIRTERPTVPVTVVATDGVVCTDAHLQKFVEFLGEQQFEVRIDFEDNIRLMFEDTNIADFVEERIVAFHGPDISTAYFDCSLDYGDPLEMEDDLEAEIPKMMIRIYKMAYRDGKFVRDVPEPQYDDFNDPLTPAVGEATEGETIVKLSNMKYTVVRE